jgi:hypothetical protein
MQPHQLVTWDEMRFIERHCKAAINVDQGKDFNEVMGKKFSDEDRARAAVLYGLFRDHGFYPAGLNSDDTIRWGIILKSKLQVMLEKDADLYLRKGEQYAGELIKKVIRSQTGEDLRRSNADDLVEVEI